ncbi:MAG: hypothetical protein KAH84_00560 [Thiomargarita sp.]|nr:hypothetical protein [Thiomargarita sp.]
MDIPLAILDGNGWTWTFFTRKEIIEMVPIVRDSLLKKMSDEPDLLEDWEKLLTAYKDQEYDWLVFIYPFG